MDILIPKTCETTEKEVGLDGLPLACDYAKDAKLNQRNKINQIISENMDMSYPAIELPFALFPEIEQEMETGGWCRCVGSHWYHPIWFNKQDAEVKATDEEKKVISAATFYQSTMKQQLIELHTAIEDAREDGFTTFKLGFPLYKVIEYKLTQQGWHVYCYKDFSSMTKPYSRITVKYS